MYGPRSHPDARSPLPPERQVPPEGDPAAPDPAARKRPATRSRWAGRRSGRSPRTATAEEVGRDPFFDNAKFLAIVLVACAHSWEPFRGDSRAATGLYMFVYTFHMPAFIVISGYFSRSFDVSPHRLRRLVTGVLVPYVIFEVAYAYFRRWTENDPDYPINIIDPQFLNWFLIALFVWRLSAPLWRVLRWPLPIAVGLAVMSSLTPEMDNNLDMQRVLQFLPFFVLGLLLKPEHFAVVRRRWVRLLAVPVSLVALVVAYWAATRLNYQWFYHRDSGQELGVPALTAGVMTVALFVCSVVMTVCFLAWVPRRRMWFTARAPGRCTDTCCTASW